jgi:hypothetical protein
MRVFFRRIERKIEVAQAGSNRTENDGANPDQDG